MDVRIDEPGGHVATLQVDRLSAVVVAETHDRAVLDGDAAVDDATGKDVDDLRVDQQQVHRGVAPGRGDNGDKVHIFFLMLKTI